MDLVVRPRKQVAQIMGKDFFRRDSGSYPNFLNHPPDIASVQSLARSGNENQPGDNAFFGAVGAQRPRQLVGNQNDPLLALVANQDFPFVDALQSNRFEFIGLLFADTMQNGKPRCIAYAFRQGLKPCRKAYLHYL